MKHSKLKKLILVVSCLAVLFVGSSVPIGAVVNGPVVPDGSTGLYGLSPFPYTVGFVCADQNTNYNYIFATNVGGYGLSNNQVIEGDDIFEWYYPNQSDSEISAIRYTNVAQSYDTSYLHWYRNNEGAYNDYYGGHGSITLEYDTVSTEFDSIVDSIIIKASQVFYNPIWLFHQVDDWIFEPAQRTNGIDYMVPTLQLPTASNGKFVGSYSVQVKITDVDGVSTWHNYSVSIDTSSSNPSIPFISYGVLKSYIGDVDDYSDLDLYNSTVVDSFHNTTLMIDEYYGFLDVDYFEFINGSYVLQDYSELHNQVNVTFPLYNTAGATLPTDVQNHWFAFPYASKFMDSLGALHPDSDVLPEIPEDMYQDYAGWLTTAVGGFMGMQFAPGITLGGIVGILIMLGCVMWMLKIFAGG